MKATNLWFCQSQHFQAICRTPQGQGGDDAACCRPAVASSSGWVNRHSCPFTKSTHPFTIVGLQSVLSSPQTTDPLCTLVSRRRALSSRAAVLHCRIRPRVGRIVAGLPYTPVRAPSEFLSDRGLSSPTAQPWPLTAARVGTPQDHSHTHEHKIGGRETAQRILPATNAAEPNAPLSSSSH